VTRKGERFSIIQEMRRQFPLRWLLVIAHVSRAGYYKWLKTCAQRNSRRQAEQTVRDHIMAIHRLHPYYGYIRMTTALRKEGLQINHKRVYRLMKRLEIQSVIRKKRRFFSKEVCIVNPNRLDREFRAERPIHKLVTDITYVRAGEQFYYLSVIQDLYNNEVVAWHLSIRNDLKLVMQTLEKLHIATDLHGTMLHSDQGFQYTTKHYNKRLEEYGMIASHSRRGNCHDNACIESFFSHLKTEKIYLTRPKTADSLYTAIEEYIEFYNHNRFQKKLNNRPPVEYRETAVA